MGRVALDDVSGRNVLGELLDTDRVPLDDHEVVGDGLDLLRNLTSSPPGTANDHMILHLHDFLHVATPLDGMLQVQLDDEGRDVREAQTQPRNPTEQYEDRERATPW